jgi:glycosyl transferase, family 25
LQFTAAYPITREMRIYLINLARRPDRLAAMTGKAAALGLTLDRVDALDAAEVSPPDARFDDKGPLGEIPRGDKCCTLSHVKAWEQFIASGDAYAAILEDDVILTPSAAAFLRDASWIPHEAELVKLELYGPPGQSVLLSDFRKVANGFQLARMHSRHTGGAAYILSRAGAQRLLAVTRFSLPVDHLLFNPNNSPVSVELKPWQLLPAVARQQDFVGEKSDIEGWRTGLRKLSWTYITRELVRFGYDLKLLPCQLALLIGGKAKFTRVGIEPTRPPPGC